MKIAAQCSSPLLQKSLELFLDKHLSSYNKCDIVVRDEPCLNDERCFYISSDEKADLKKPFSKSQLILALEKRYAILNPQSDSDSDSEDSSQTQDPAMDFNILEKRIESLTQEYQSNIIRAVKAFYEK
ncbi:MAG: hypothetical protein SPLUMA2_SPLUMAMAG2_01203 [uncultured Sulfurimonas sp.]|nr:MAG: hypothetical protein SPLUMA1_SPLUMAMAG1_00009 [uncultured Sulfurimonas sp.]CAI6164692.1 MAG: hypothetical protein SPLUMA2_SPLUMAMAG2_01203 [uncultured Sulfurimonas sp.]